MEDAEAVLDRAGSVRAVERAFSILDVLAEARSPLTMAEVALALDLHQATAHRLLNTLVASTWVERSATTGRYSLGIRAMTAGTVALASSPLVLHSRDSLRRLAEQTGYNSYLSVLIGNRVTYLVRCEGRYGLTNSREFEPGAITHPAYSMADGKVLLAALSSTERRLRLGDEPLRALTSNTIVDLEALDTDLNEIRLRGFAVDNGERYSFLRGVAVPLLGRDDAVTASLLCIARATDLSTEMDTALSQEMTLCATEISHRFGHAFG